MGEGKTGCACSLRWVGRSGLVGKEDVLDIALNVALKIVLWEVDIVIW